MKGDAKASQFELFLEKLERLRLIYNDSIDEDKRRRVNNEYN